MRKLGELPAGTIIEYQGDAYLLWRGRLRRWSFAGYDKPVAVPRVSDDVQVIAPASIVRVFDIGFAPQVYPTAYY